MLQGKNAIARYLVADPERKKAYFAVIKASRKVWGNMVPCTADACSQVGAAVMADPYVT